MANQERRYFAYLDFIRPAEERPKPQFTPEEETRRAEKCLESRKNRYIRFRNKILVNNVELRNIYIEKKKKHKVSHKKCISDKLNAIHTYLANSLNNSQLPPTLLDHG